MWMWVINQKILSCLILVTKSYFNYSHQDDFFRINIEREGIYRSCVTCNNPPRCFVSSPGGGADQASVTWSSSHSRPHMTLQPGRTKWRPSNTPLFHMYTWIFSRVILGVNVIENKNVRWRRGRKSAQEGGGGWVQQTWGPWSRRPKSVSHVKTKVNFDLLVK